MSKKETQSSTQLSSLAYHVTQEGGTEPPFSNDNFPDSLGIFHCICCNSALFDSQTKFNSGTGWPSFYAPLGKHVIELHEDYHLFIKRTEVRCAACNGHLGHVFGDGPEPTGLRYCINGVALSFKELD